MSSCNLCDREKTARTMVAGRGATPADVLFIGDMPNRSDDALGEPFRDAAGRILDNLIAGSGLGRFSIYFTNMVYCYAPHEPTTEEIMICMPNTIRLIDRIGAAHIVLLGGSPKKFYNSLLRGSAVCIMHPEYIHKTGGIHSPYYLKTMRQLEDLCQQLG